jgi:AI-2 transport protein TqsA
MRDTKLMVVFLGLLAFLAVGFVLNILEPILLPFVVAVFLSRIFGPLNKALRRRRVPAALSILLVLILVSIGLLIFGWAVYSSAQAFTAALPRYQARTQDLMSGVTAWLSSSFPRLEAQIRQMHWENAFEVSSLTGFAAALLGSFLVFANDAFLVLLFLVFLLAGSEGFPQKIRRALDPASAERLGDMIHNIEAGVRRYILTKTLINLMTGALVTVLLALFGADFPLLWGLLTFLAHYIPSVGAVISVGLPTIFLFLQFSPGMALVIAILNAALQFVIGNAVEPRIMGSSLDLSPLLVLLSLIFWGWLWGPWGMILSVPITSTIKIVCENVESLRPLAVLMGGPLEEAKPKVVAQATSPSGSLS